MRQIFNALAIAMGFELRASIVKVSDRSWRPRANHRWRGLVTPAKRGKGAMRPVDSDVVSSIQRHAAMTWAQRLKRVFNINIDIDIEVCDHCGGSVKVIACIEDQSVIDSILAHLREKGQGRPALSHLVPPSRTPPGPLPLFAGRESTAPNQQGRH